MATGDILSSTVRADGWSIDITIEGFTTGATYDFGSLASAPSTLATPKFTLAVVSEGYSSAGVLGTIARTVYGTHIVRKVYPDQLVKDEVVSGSNIIVRVALSESIYLDDNTGAGKSGTAPTITIAAGWATNTGGGSQTSAAATTEAVTNNSTLTYPKVIAQWAWGHTPVFQRVTASFSIGCIAYHGHGIACVTLSATDAHASVVSGTATTKTSHLMSASGLYYESYDLSVPVTSFTEGDDITLKYIAYPLVGDAACIIDTSTDTTYASVPKGYAKITCTLKTTGLTTMYVASTGNDTTGNGSSGTPYLTIGKALAQSPDIILIKTGSGAVDTLGTTPLSVTAKTYCIEVMPETGGITLNRTTAAYQFKAKHLRYSGFTIASAGEAYSFEDNTTYSLQFANCSITRTGVLPSQPPGNTVPALFFTNNTYDHAESFGLETTWHYAITGCSIKGGILFPRGLVANLISGDGTNDDTRINETATGDTTNNVLYVNNKFVGLRLSGNAAVSIGDQKSATNTAFIGNIVEASVVTGAPNLLSLSGGGVYASSNIIYSHNTCIGQRCNVFYNDIGIAAVYHNNIFMRNNALQSFNIKTDTFITANANRIGNWASVNGVNFYDNRYDGTADAAFTCDYDGINGAFVVGKDQTFGQLGYTTDNSAIGAGTGNGNYLPAVDSVLRGHTLIFKDQSYSQNGTILG